MSDQPQRSFNLEFPPPNAHVQNEPEQDNLDGNNEAFQEEENEPMQEEYVENGQPIDEELLNTVAELENDFRLTHDPESGAELLKIYKNAEDMENVRRIRESLLEYSTLSEKDWLDWIDDEINTAKTDEEKKAILKLVDRALEESLFYDVAKLGISYVKGLYNKGVTRRQGVKITIEKAINAFCYDFYNGSKMFKKLRKFELGNAEVKNEAEREKTVRALYERQIKLPYADITQTLDEYLGWEKNDEEKEKMVKVYKETYNDITTHLDFEDKFQEALEDENTEKLGEVLTEIVNTDKLKLEKKINFFERCIVANPAELKVWEKYSELAEKNLKANSSALERIYRRAVKNCPGNIQFTRSYLRVLEKLGTDAETLKKKIISMLFSFSSSADYYFLRLQLCEIYIRMLNAKLVEVKGDVSKAKEETIYCRQAIQEAIQFFSSDLTAEHQAYIANFWLLKANIETYTIKDKQQMNQSMDKYVQTNGSQFQAWNLYVTFEQALGRPDTVRRILKRGCEYTKDDIVAMHTLAIEYERKFGNLEELDNAERRFQEKKEKLAQEDPTNVALLAESDINNVPKPVEQANKKAKGKGREKEREGLGKRKYNDKDQADDEEARHVTRQVKKTETREEPKKMEEEKQVEENGASKEETMKEEKTEHPPHREAPAYPEDLDKRNTVFVRNLPASFTVPDIRAIFVNMDKIIECRMGKTKGTAYIDFSTKEDAVLACENNNVKIDGQKLFVALSDPPKKGKDDRKTLFINNLPFDVTREAIAEAFKKWGSQITDIRIPTSEDNKPKGFAYLVLDNEQILDEIITECKDLHIGGRKVKVEHADSSKRHQQQTLQALHVAFIKNLNFKVREEDLQEFFKDFTVKQIHLVRDKKTKKPTGLAFVEFATLEDLKSAIALPEPKILGRQIDISKSDRPITHTHDAPEAPETNPKKKSFLSKKDAQKEEPVPAAAKPNFPIPMHIKKMVPAKASSGGSMSQTNTGATPANTTNTTNATGNTGPAAPGMKSNSYFKDLLAGKK